MNEIRLGRIFENACRLAGRDPLDIAPPTGWAVLAGMTLAAGIRTLAAEKFPMMQRIEFRRFRPTWSRSVTYSLAQEVWYDDAYWRLDDTTASGEPGVAAGWTKLRPGEVWAFINWEQPWENTIIDPAGVDMNDFAYAADPKYNPHATPVKSVGMYEYGIELDARTAPPGVWVKFVPEYPQIGFTEWVSGTMYSAGDVVYRTATKDVYCCQKNIEEEVSDVQPEGDEFGFWTPVRIRGEFEPYLTRLLAADLMTEDQAKSMTRAAADRELEILRERHHEGNGEVRIRTGRFY